MKVRLLLLLLIVAACRREDTGPPARGPVTPLDPASTGAIHGHVAFAGEPPAETTIMLFGDPFCAAAHSGKVSAGDARVKNGRVGGAFVYISKGLEGRVFAIPEQAVTIDQRGCLYEPHVVGIQAGQELEFRSSDATLHNVHTEPAKSAATNFGMAIAGSKRSVRFDASEVMVKVRCDVHPWMRAFLGVLDHPYFEVTPDDGSFNLDGVPAGKYTLAVWHERFGTRETEISVSPKKTVEATFQYGG